MRNAASWWQAAWVTEIRATFRTIQTAPSPLLMWRCLLSFKRWPFSRKFWSLHSAWMCHQLHCVRSSINAEEDDMALLRLKVDTIMVIPDKQWWLCTYTQASTWLGH